MLAIETGIAPSVWWREDEATIATALELLDDARRERNAPKWRAGDEGRVMSGGG